MEKCYIKSDDFYCIGKDLYYYDYKTYIEDDDNEDEEDDYNEDEKDN